MAQPTVAEHGETGVSDPMLPRPVRVVRKRRETSDAVTLQLGADDASAFAFTPGQFTMLYAFGVGEVPLSISGDSADSKTLTHTVRRLGPVTEALSQLRPGDPAGVRGPYGVGWPLAHYPGADIVIVAGGAGAAAVRSLIYAVLANRAAYGYIAVLVGARQPGDIFYRKELDKLCARTDLDVRVTVDRAPPAWQGPVGVVPRFIPALQLDPDETVAFVCGPRVMMRVTADALIQRGVAPEHIYLSLERNMKCATGFCGHCQLGPTFVCKDGPVYSWGQIGRWLAIKEL